MLLALLKYNKSIEKNVIPFCCSFAEVKYIHN